MSEQGKEIARFADVAMYEAAHNPLADEGLQVEPQVYVVNMTPRPLQTLAAAAELYDGNIVHDPRDVSRETAEKWLQNMTRTILAAPLEWVDISLFLEGVTRAFSHQIVRERTGVFVQESQRFAVKTNARWEIAYPPSIADLPVDHPMRVIWDQTNERDAWAYNALIAGGIPAEDARGRLVTNITTRLHYKTNLRNLTYHAGLRLCTQAQYEWKVVWSKILKAISEYGPEEDRWQQELICSLFQPICYRTGKCEFMASTDRACRIRDRVEEHHRKGEPSHTWVDISPHEPVMEGAARVRPGQ